MRTRCMGCMEKMDQGPVCNHCGFEQTTQNKNYQLPVGTLLDGRYTIGKVLGQGGFGITYLGWDNDLDIKVAIKEFYPSGAVMRDSAVSTTVKQYGGNSGESFFRNRERFLNEAKALAKFSEESGIVHVFSFFEENNTAYIIMEYLPGMTLKAYARQRGGKLPAKEVWDLIRPVIETLKKVHGENIVHRDISPDNLMLLPDGRVKLLDFGALRVVEHADKHAQLTSATEAILKAGYAPMEQYQNRGSLGPWTDVYALCATIGYLLSGQVPPESLDRVTGEADEAFISQYPGLTKRQRQVLEAGLAIRPENRISSMEDLESALFSDKGKIKTGNNNGKKKQKVRSVIAAGVAAAAVLAFMLLPKERRAEPSVAPEETSGIQVREETSFGSPDNILMPVNQDFDSEYGPFMVPGSQISREDIVSIQILDNLDTMPEDAWDISQNQDGSVMAWVIRETGNRYRLYIAGQGGVWAPENCYALFANYTNAVSMEFGQAFHTENAQDFTMMFLSCHALTSLDLSGFDTGNVYNMNYMFGGCYSLDSLDISGFETGNVQYMTNMFSFSIPYEMYEDGGLSYSGRIMGGPSVLDLSHFDTSNVFSYGWIFEGAYVEVLDISSFDFSLVSQVQEEYEQEGNHGRLGNIQLGIEGSWLSELYLPEQMHDVGMEEWNLSEDCRVYHGADRPENASLDSPFVQPAVSGTLMQQKVLVFFIDENGGSANPALRLETNAQAPAFGMPITKNSVVSITFLDTLADAPEDAWDVSQLQDRSVLAWAEGKGSYNWLYIAAEGGVQAPADSSGLFAYYRNLEQIHWNDAFHTDQVTNMKGMFLDCEALSTLDLRCFNTGCVTDMSQMFKFCYNLESLDTSSFDTSQVTDMTEMFAVGISSYSENSEEDTDKWIQRTFESKLKTLDLRHLNTSSVQSMKAMFYMCNGLEELNLTGFATENVTDFSYMFSGCSRLKQLDVSGFQTANARKMEAMFEECKNLQTLNVRNFDTSNVTNMKNMFDYCETFTNLDLGSFNTGKVTDMSGMFSNCTNLNSLNISSFDTSNVTTMNGMFWFCQKLGYLNLGNFNTSNVTDMGYMFHACDNITVNVSSFDTSKVTNMMHMFYSCRTLPDISHFDTGNVTRYDDFASPYLKSGGKPWHEFFKK